MKVKIAKDNYYPYFMLTNGSCDYEIFVTDAKVKKWNKIFQQFEQTQKEIQEAIKNSTSTDIKKEPK